MNIIILPGNSKRNKEWADKAEAAFMNIPTTGLIYKHYYKHWETGEPLIDLDAESIRLKENLPFNQPNVILAKSAGTLLAMYGHTKGVIQPEKAFFFGMPAIWAKTNQIPFEISGWDVPTTVIQNINDPITSSAELKVALITKNNFTIIEQEGDTHEYDNFEEVIKDEVLVAKGMKKLYFISGVSGVGKTSTIKHFKGLLPAESYDIRDFDERGVPDGGGPVWHKNETLHWLKTAEGNAQKGKNTIVSGFINPDEFKKIHKPGHISSQLILLHASKEVLENRLRDRHSTQESIREIERAAGTTLASFIENVTTFAPTLRSIFEREGGIIIDTDSRNPEEVAREVKRVVFDR